LLTLSQLPGRFESLASRVERGDLVQRNPELERRMRVLDSSIRRATAGLVFTGLVISGVMSLQSNQSLGYSLIGISALPMLYALGFGRFTK
jgi:hypothetical protein